MLTKLKIFTDGGARGNPGPAASGAVIDGIAGKERLICGKYLGIDTNNVAEYNAVLMAYEVILAEGVDPAITDLDFYADSLLVVRQLLGQYKMKNPNLANYFNSIKDKERLFHQVNYNHIPREQNKLADREVNRVLDAQKAKF